MQATVFTLMFLASAPILLVPTFIAIASRRGHAAKVVPANILLWVILYFAVRSIVVNIDGSLGMLPFQPSVLLVLLAWLALLRYALVGGTTSAAAVDSAQSKTGMTDEVTDASSNKSLERTRDR